MISTSTNTPGVTMLTDANCLPAASQPPSLSGLPSPSTLKPAVAVCPDKSTKAPSLFRCLTTSSLPMSFAPLVTGPSTVASPRKIATKPKRPLTAYHIYFQIEREFIIQTMTGEDEDKSIHEGKILFHDVPKRYINTKLSPDWYFGPGKRAKRKHRRKHGKIGFLELSRIITSRWTKLEETNPDIKQFVSKLAKQELAEYKRELKEYNENLTKRMILPVIASNRSCSMNQQTASQWQAQTMAQFQVLDYPQTSRGNSSFSFHHRHPCEDTSIVENTFQLHQDSNRLKNEYYYANTYQQKQISFKWGERQPQDDFVDICDEEILSLWKTANSE